MNKKITKEVAGLKKDTNEVDSAIKLLQSSISNINGGMNLLDPDNLTIVEKGKKANINSDTIKFSGVDRKNQDSIQHSMQTEMEDKYKSTVYHTSTGIYKHIFMARRNAYLSREFPNLKKSLRLFNTDVCYGSFFAADCTTEKFKIYKNGIPVTDVNTVETIMGIINPPATSKSDIANNSFDTLDFDCSLVSRRDGYGYIRLVSNKKVLLDLYLKYVMKTEKNKTANKRVALETITPANEDAVESLNIYLEELGYSTEPITLTTNLKKTVPPKILSSFPKSLLTAVNSSSLNKEDTNKIEEGFENYEAKAYATETFSDFAYRMLSGKAATTAVYTNKTTNGSTHAYSIGVGPTSYSKDTSMDIYNEAFGGNNRALSIGLESSSEYGVDVLVSNLNIFNKSALENISFEELYSIDTSVIIDKIKDSISKNIEYGIEKFVYKNDKVKKNTTVFEPIETVVKNLIISDERSITVGMENELNELSKHLNIKEGGMFGLESVGTSFTSLGSITEGTNLKQGTAKLRTDMTAQYDKASSKVLKMFKNIKGVNTVILDNSRIIPAMMGSKNNGAFYIEKSHSEVEHLVATRSMMSSPLSSGGATGSIYQMDEEAKEETMGRLIFSDTIKPLIERNMSTKFLRDNADLMYTIKQLLEENEMSRNDSSFGSFNDMGFFNMSKVSYIPASELVMYTNGTELGESVYEEAFTSANAYVLARESYLSWLLVDGKGFCILEIPKGLSDLSGEYGADNFARIINENICTRKGLKTGSTENLTLSKRFIPLPVTDEFAGKLNIVDIKPPDFEIDDEVISKWQEEATGIVGYPASLFSTLDGGGIELAKKIESMNSSIVLDVVQAQDRKVGSSNQLATQLLRLRGGKAYNEYTIEWLPPRPSRSSTSIRKEMLDERKEAIDSYMEVYENVLGTKEDWDIVKPFMYSVLATKLYKDDKILNSIESSYKEAQGLAKIKTTQEADEE